MDQTGLPPDYNLGQTSVRAERQIPPLNRAFLLLPAGGLMGSAIAISVYRPVEQGPFLWLLLILFIATIFLISHIQRKARSGGDVSSFFPTIYWLACAPAVLALALWLNGALDHSPPESHRQLVTRKYVTHGRHGTGYYIELTSWRPNRTTEKVSVPYQQYNEFRIDDPIIIDVQKGALAIPWIGKVRQPQAEDLN